jgi:coproporphyrinogen III oxidase
LKVKPNSREDLGNVQKVAEEERVIENGKFSKRRSQYFSSSRKLPAMQKMFNVGEADFFACGLSLVIHPKTQWCQRFTTGVISKCMTITEM